MQEKIKINLKRLAILPVLSLSLVGLIFMKCSGPATEKSADLEKGFLNPPESARPRVWWHWMNGNITKEGIRADLEWMKRVKIGGFQNFDAALSTPQVVEKRLIYMTPEWKDAFLFTAKLADSLDLEMAIAGSPGWSESGGPWVTPAQAMKKFVWSETEVKGGQPFEGYLPKPPASTGTFQNIEDRKDEATAQSPEYYADAAVVAFRIPENDISMAKLKPKVTSSGGKFDLIALTDGDLAKSTFLPSARSTGTAWIQFEFAKPETIHSLTIVAGQREDDESRALEISDNGLQFRIVTVITEGDAAQSTITFPPATARFFRVTFTKQADQSATPGSENNERGRSDAQRGTQIAELDLHSVARVNRFEDKAGFSSFAGLYSLATPSVAEVDAISRKEVIDLTMKMQPDGKLNWTPPAGRWIIQRLGYSLTGKNNHPASPEATGLEVDKLSAGHVRAYFENYLDQYKNATNGLMGRKGLQFVVTDSWEAGTLNWTDNMLTDFKNHRGYDMIPWLPVLTGHIVESAEASDRFLWDFRKTIADLTAENHYDQLTTLLHERGMGRYTESHEGGRALVADGMEVKRKADIPMSATWTPQVVGSNDISTVHKADIRESASVAHIYGQNLVAAESMTAIGTPWAWSPEYLKPTADMELSSGLNRFVIHCSVHQPVFDKIPGLGLGPFGQWFTRNETWAEEAGAWTTYLARNSFMLQQGKFIADIAWFYGEDNNITALFDNKLPDVPSSYNYDFVNSDVIVNVLSVKNNEIVTPGGMSYRVLALDANSKQMSLAVLRKISELVKAGAVVAGEKPVGTPSLGDDQVVFKTIADELWANENGENSVGNGKIYAGKTIADVLASLKIAPDFEYNKPQSNSELLFVHRKLEDIDIYWINNRNNRAENFDATFRVKGKEAEVWHPETGKIEKVSYNIENGHTRVSLKMEPDDAVFVVFRNKARTSALRLTQPVEKQLATIDGPWNISFQPNRGAPGQIVLGQLASWSDNTDPGVKYFSGRGTYTKTIQAPADWFKEGAQIWLDLGSVKNLAEIVVNGKSLGVVWKSPFRENITEALKQGENALEVRVTNLWVNRLIGDLQPGAETKITYTTQPFYKADSPLVPSGLLGPVTILGLTK
jgi:hypothetical protein